MVKRREECKKEKYTVTEPNILISSLCSLRVYIIRIYQ